MSTVRSRGLPALLGRWPRLASSGETTAEWSPSDRDRARALRSERTTANSASMLPESIDPPGDKPLMIPRPSAVTTYVGERTASDTIPPVAEHRDALMDASETKELLEERFVALPSSPPTVRSA